MLEAVKKLTSQQMAQVRTHARYWNLQKKRREIDNQIREMEESWDLNGLFPEEHDIN